MFFLYNNEMLSDKFILKYIYISILLLQRFYFESKQSVLDKEAWNFHILVLTRYLTSHVWLDLKIYFDYFAMVTLIFKRRVEISTLKNSFTSCLAITTGGNVYAKNSLTSCLPIFTLYCFTSKN